ncbi:3921_t:CDS:2 [Entrophospora sp. SA101]|nr:9362_t:CDS:2 [Entrophospora sp. SA101]CAJ0841143.1 3921_t:CDS:2 [Entrophospora sp. SA101]
MSNNNTRPLIVGQEVPVTPYPVKMKGEVIKGFGRGSKELGIPKANLPEALFEEICKCMEPGIYYGWAQGGIHIIKMRKGVRWASINDM